jgi:hypothetical protein
MKLLLLSLFLISCNNSTEPNVVYGCTDSIACNFNANANIFDNSCAYEIDDCDICGGENVSMDCIGVCGGNAIADCNGECCDPSVTSGDNICVEVDVCDICGGDGSTCESLLWTIYYNTSTPIGGFQFEVEGVTVDGVSGGAAGDAGFTVSTGNNTVIGFSLSGSTVPVGDGILVVLDVTGSGDACIVEESLIISDAAAAALPADVENCNTIQIP